MAIVEKKNQQFFLFVSICALIYYFLTGSDERVIPSVGRHYNFSKATAFKSHGGY